jgi:8-oxo-dGTP pyrophosphatase MutT (NUDIX family)
VQSLFRYCFRCGADGCSDKDLLITCEKCGLTFHRNPAVSVAAILLDSENRVLLIERAKDPARGKLGLPGGFVDVNETAEEALRREVFEEVGLELASAEFYRSFPNTYLYKEIIYPVLDLVFVCRPKELVISHQASEVLSSSWRSSTEFQPDDIAFVSIREALRSYFRME